MEIKEKHKEIVEKLVELQDKFILVCHDDTENQDETTVYSRFTYPSGLAFIGTIIDAFMENAVPSFGRENVIRDIVNTVNFIITNNKTQMKEDAKTALDNMTETLSKDNADVQDDRNPEM